MKKFLVLLLETACLLGAGYAVANDGGKVILDLQDETSVQSTKDDIPAVIEMGVNYWNDVKEYDELLDGENLNKDFSADIMAKYPNYSKQSAEIWQQYVKKGIKGYRFYKDVKQKVVNWLLNREMPLVVDDNQYEMGEPEKYVERFAGAGVGMLSFHINATEDPAGVVDLIHRHGMKAGIAINLRSSPSSFGMFGKGEVFGKET